MRTVLFGLSPRSTSQTSLGVVAELFPTRPTSLDVKVVSSFPLRPSSLAKFPRSLNFLIRSTSRSRALSDSRSLFPSSCRSSSCCSELLPFELLLFELLLVQALPIPSSCHSGSFSLNFSVPSSLSDDLSRGRRIFRFTRPQGRQNFRLARPSGRVKFPIRTTSRSSEFPTRPTSSAQGRYRGRQVFRFARPQGR